MFEAIQAKGEKGYARLVSSEELTRWRCVADELYTQVTNYGNLNLELYCDRAPRTCYNFLQVRLSRLSLTLSCSSSDLRFLSQLARDNKYADTIFHRLIPGFMLQGGDPTGSGRGGQSTWGKPFDDEYNLRNARRSPLLSSFVAE
jgi:peptidyl-prolyl cis-trans isomerase-like 2